MNSEVQISISENGIFFNQEQFDMLRYKLLELDQKFNFSYTWTCKESPYLSWNCAQNYYFFDMDFGFIRNMDYWFRDDLKSLSQPDFDNIKRFYEQKKIRMNVFKKIKANFNINIENHKNIKIPTGQDFTYYNGKKTQIEEYALSRVTIYHKEFMPSNEYIHSHNKHYDLFHAILNNDNNKVASLINSGCIASFIDKKRLLTPLDTTIITDNAEICELLIKNGADVNSITDNKTAVTQILFSEHKNLDMLKLLLLYGGKLNFSFVINYNVRLEILTPCYMGKDLDDFLFLRKYHDPGRKIKPDY